MATRKTTKSTPAKSTKTAPAKKSAKKVTPAKSTYDSVPRDITPSSKKGSFKVKRSYIIPVIGILLLAGLLYAFRSLFVAAMVNGQPISRISLVRELEKQNGKQALNSLITKTLIFQEAQEQNVTVSDEEVNAELKRIEQNLSQQGQKLDQVLALQGMTKETLIEQIKIQKLIEKMVGKDIKVSNEEVDQYIQSNSESFPTDTDPEQLKKDVAERLRQEKLNEKVQSWLENIQKNAQINYFVTY